ncbi:hypothetical protein [Roseovarius aestuarii]|uniref:Lipoprotein n=1 Tax=Roseovarius aestuarii TaxID=475083 RepID=A0A1X7BX47_9RHOB|nr:hypothetical protein [Roseovarius aestuarii]SMC14193.1 hypothetical protein ROA7745_04058 [Roseovarius aestuarii]
MSKRKTIARHLSLICVATALSACALPKTDVVARLGADPVTSGGTYTSGGGLTVAVDLREWQGQTLVCGVWAKSRQQSVLTARAEHQVLGSGAVFLGQERFLSNLLYMRQVDPAPSYGGREANCANTGRAWQSSYATLRPTIRIPRQVVANESDGLLVLGGPIVRFRQTGPGAGDS